MSLPEPLTESERIQQIQDGIRAESLALRQRHPWLRHQDWIGLGIFLTAVAGTLGSGWLYLNGTISAWWCIPLVAFFTAFLHELEHDLLHWLYFKRRKPVHHLMLLVGWMLRPGTINPWIRRHLHFRHHKVSGTEADLEERGIGNGQAYGALRFWLMADTFTANLFQAWRHAPPGKRIRALLRITAANAPFAVLTALLGYGFLAFHAVSALAETLGLEAPWSPSTQAFWAGVQPLIVALIAPFYLRSFCLNFISSNMHYYGGVNSLLQQTQVLNAWFLMPFQLFCCNFGSTHGIHHFVVGEPFYIRQMTARTAHRLMRAQGVRFNDLGTFRRANRYPAFATTTEGPHG